MARGINKVILVGNLGQDPETRYMPSGNAVTNISIATSESWKDKQTGEQQERTEWHRLTMYRRLAEIAGEYLKKGSQAMVEGRMQTRSWDDAGTGKKMYRTEVVADSVQFGSRPQGVANMAPQSENPVSAPSAPQIDTIEYPEEDINPEDIPF